MKMTLRLLALMTGLSMAAFAEDWTGKLIDATCNDQRAQEKTVSCDANAATSVFALNVAGKIYKLDPTGNSKAAAALKYRVGAPSAPQPVPVSEVRATVTGTEAGGMIMVEKVGLQ
jgi:hypothetical protein